MVRIIHISDSHNNSKAVEALHRRLSNESKCDVIAHTGDIENTCTDRVPHGWNDWPQKHKLSVPGNHDTSPGLFDSWTTWITKPPYALAVQDLLFVGLSEPRSQWISELQKLYNQSPRYRGVVVLAHYSPFHNNYPEFKEFLLSIRKNCPVLFLHGHEHPNEFKGDQWTRRAKRGVHDMFVSHVCSAAKNRLGMIHHIQWNGTLFSSKPIQCL
jgi:hypothetical protein